MNVWLCNQSKQWDVERPEKVGLQLEAHTGRP